jgi:type IV pilus assembly protein PilE
MKKAFTLLEMLVVIGIISVLVTMGFVSYSTAQKKARDSKRQSDLKSFQAALEQCYSVNDYTYPTITLGANAYSVSFICPSADGPSAEITDPTTKIYTRTQDTDANTYTVGKVLELSTTPVTISQQQ